MFLAVVRAYPQPSRLRSLSLSGLPLICAAIMPSVPYAYVCCWCGDREIAWQRPPKYSWVWHGEEGEWQDGVLICQPCRRETWRDLNKLEPGYMVTPKSWYAYVVSRCK